MSHFCINLGWSYASMPQTSFTAGGYSKQMIMLWQANNRAMSSKKSDCKGEKIGRKHWESHLTPTVPHVHNGRYKHEHRPFSMFITVGVRRLVAGVPPYFDLLFAQYSQGFQAAITIISLNRYFEFGCGRMGHGGHHPTIRGGHHPTSVALFYEKSLHQNGIGSMI